MAFNPFHSFRKHSKVVFAGLTILCMVTFILSSGMGRGDFFSQMTDWFAGRVSRNAYATLYGKTYSGQDVQAIEFQRHLASDYMDYAVGGARAGLERRLMELSKQLDPDTRRQVERLLSERDFYVRLGYVQQLPSMLYGVRFQIQQAETQKKTDLVHALGTFAKLLELDFILLANRRPNERFFGPIDKQEDTINFLLWRHQADELGVRLSHADVDQMIKDETRDELAEQDAGVIARTLRERYKAGFSEDALYAALTDEFRVRIAQLALTGTATGSGRHTLTASPTDQTPDESWALFKDARTTVRAGLIGVPVKAFVDKVTATPPEDELRKLFDKHKNDEPAPDREEPGFKEPRKIQVAWVGASPDLPFYQAAADKVLALAPALRLLGNTAAASQLVVPVQLDAELLYQEKAFRDREQPWTSPVGQVHESSTQRAENVAALVGAAVGAAATGAPAVPSGLLTMQSWVLTREAKDRATVGLGLIGLAAAPDPLGVFGAPVAAMPKVSLGQVRQQLLEKAKTELLTGGPAGRFDQTGTQPVGLIASDLYAFRGEVMKLGREKGKDAVAKYVETFVKERGLESGHTTEPRDQHHLGDDPGLAPLKEAYRKAHGDRDILLRQFGPYFFSDQAQMTGAPDGLFIPHRFVTAGVPGEKRYDWWRTEDIPARVPKYEAARPAVLEAWRRIQARDLARKEADRLLQAVKQTPREAANLRDVAAQNGGREFFELGPIALYMPQLNPTAMGLSRTYATVQPGMTPEQLAQVYHIPADKVAFPDAEMIKTLLGLREQEKGATAVVSDRPRMNFYVATLLERSEPPVDEFRRAYQGSMARATEADPLLAMLAHGRPDAYRKAVLEQLKAEAKLELHDAAKRREDRSE